MDNQVNLELMSFIETKILPRYTNFGRSHGLVHVQKVISNSLNIAKMLGADVNMAYTIAAYHDLGIAEQRAIHHLIGGRILANDARLKQWFTNDQILIMKNAVEDHRASSSHTPRSLYGKIIAEADRDLEPNSVFQRIVEYGLEQNPECDKETQWKSFKNHLHNKYSASGYIRLWIPNSPNEEGLKKIRTIINDETKLKEIFDKFYNKEKSNL
jgi:uncharacterized protein